MRLIWMTVGFVCLGLGAIGAVLPLLPTTPFVLVSAFCFARSSPRFHAWLINHRAFGPAIRAWNEERAIGRKAKIAATFAMGAAFLLSVLLGFNTIVLVIQGLVIIPVLTFIWTRPTAKAVEID